MKVFSVPKVNRDYLLGKFVDDSDDFTLIDEDCDLYAVDKLHPQKKDEENIIFKFRKNVFSKKEQEMAYEGLIGAATQSQNRGLAAGPRGNRLLAKSRGGRDWVTEWQEKVITFFSSPDRLDDELPAKIENDVDNTRGRVWLRSKVIPVYGEYEGWFDRWIDMVLKLGRKEQAEEAYNVSLMISDTNYAQSVMSGIAGFYDRYPRIPYGRACTYNEKNVSLFEKSFPYLRRLNDIFKDELPQRWGAQNKCVQQLDKKFVIDDTVFTTLTVNHNWRTAAHRDAGDLNSGFSNISAVGKGWEGAKFLLPEYNVSIDLQPGDLLLVNNHEGIHANTELEGDNPDRMSIVAYFRENMLKLKSWEYEQLRRQFVENNKNNQEHPLWNKMWNGVFPGMWESKEWEVYLQKHNMEDEDGLVGIKSGSLESFFT